jgi:hypothetical protein
MAAPARGAPVPVFRDGFSSGWSGTAYALNSGSFNFSSTVVRRGGAAQASMRFNSSHCAAMHRCASQAHLGTGRAIRAALAPYGTLVLRSASRAVGTDAARVALYINALGDAAPRAAPLALGISIATFLGSGASVPVASLCRVTQAAREGALRVSPAVAGGAADACSAGGADAAGWTRVVVSLDGFGLSGWDELQLSDVSGQGGVMHVDDVTLLRVSDVASEHVWDGNTQYCLERMDSLLYGCTVPPSLECCADYSAFNAQGCYCIAAVLAQGGADMQLATRYAAPEECGTQLMLPDDARCFVAPAGSGAGDGMPPMPELAPARPPPSVAILAVSPPPPPAPATPRAPHVAPRGDPGAHDTARDAAPYIGIAAFTAACTALAWRGVQQRVARLLREGRTDDSLLEERLLGASLIR